MNATTEHLEEDMVKKVSSLYRETYGDQQAVAYIDTARRKVKEITGTERAFFREEYEGKAELTVWSEDGITINDCLSACKLLSSYRYHPFNESYQAALLSAGSGVEVSEDKLFEFARRVKNLERAYNVREGMTRDNDSLPKRCMDKPVAQGSFQGSVLESSQFEKMKDRYYALRGWDIATGIPTRETLEQYGLGYVALELEKLGKLPGLTPPS